MRCAAPIVFAVLAGCSFHVHLTREGVGAEAAADAMDRAWNDHFAAAARKDAAAACDLYTSDVVYAVAGSPELRGRTAVEAMEKAGMATTTIASVQHFGLAVRVDGGVAHEIGSVTGEVASGGAPAKAAVFRYVAAWRRESDGRWRIAHLVGHMASQPDEAR